MPNFSHFRSIRNFQTKVKVRSKRFPKNLKEEKEEEKKKRRKKKEKKRRKKKGKRGKASKMPRIKNPKGPCSINVYSGCSNVGALVIHQQHIEKYELSQEVLGNLMCKKCNSLCSTRKTRLARDPGLIGKNPPKKLKTKEMPALLPIPTLLVQQLQPPQSSFCCREPSPDQFPCDMQDSQFCDAQPSDDQSAQYSSAQTSFVQTSSAQPCDDQSSCDVHPPSDVESSQNVHSLSGVLLPNLTKVTNSGAKCVVCGEKSGANCPKIPYFARQELLLDYKLVIGPNTNCRICSSHLNGEHLKSNLKITRTFNSSPCELEGEEAAEFIEDLIHAMKVYRRTSHLDFDSGTLTDEDYLLWTGWTKDQFDQMEGNLKTVRDSNNRSKRQCLAIFWIKLKTDLSFGHIASLLKIPDPGTNGRIAATRAFHTVATDLNDNFVPKHLGVNHISQEQSKAHNTVYSKEFFGDLPTTIWDGTYLYIFKSSNYEKGRKSYSGHKHRPLIKFMSIVFPDGYVLDSIGPFYSNGHNNDAGMTANILKNESNGVVDWILGKHILKNKILLSIEAFKELSMI